MATVSMGSGIPVGASVLLSVPTAFLINLCTARCPTTSASITTFVTIPAVFAPTI